MHTNRNPWLLQSMTQIAMWGKRFVCLNEDAVIGIWSDVPSLISHLDQIDFPLTTRSSSLLQIERRKWTSLILSAKLKKIEVSESAPFQVCMEDVSDVLLIHVSVNKEWNGRLVAVRRVPITYFKPARLTATPPGTGLGAFCPAGKTS